MSRKIKDCSPEETGDLGLLDVQFLILKELRIRNNHESLRLAIEVEDHAKKWYRGEDRTCHKSLMKSQKILAENAETEESEKLLDEPKRYPIY